MTLSNAFRGLLAIVLLISFLFTFWRPNTVLAAPTWPTTWISIGTDPDEGGGDNFRDVLEAYYQADSDYLYLRLRTVEPVILRSGNKDARYKWFVDTNNDMTFPGTSGGTVYNWEYLFYVEDTTGDGIGDAYLGTPSNPAGVLITNTDIAGYRLNSGGNYADLYIRLDQINNLADYWIGWSTDNKNPNYDQAPKLDSVESTTGIHIITKGSITAVKVVVGTPPADNWQFNYTGPGSTSGSFTIPAAGGQQILNDLPFGSYTITETTKAYYTCSPSNIISVVLSTAQPSQTTTFTNTRATAPTVNALEIYTNIGCTNPAASMDPQTTYYAKITITSNVNLSYLQTVRITLFYDSAGNDPAAPATPSTQTCAILTCTVGTPPSWTIEPNNTPPNPPNNTTWQIVSGSCSQPANLGVTTGDWVFAFIPGKVATESNAPANWDAQGLATNKASQSGELYRRNKAMNWYGEITVPASVDWGTVPLGLTFENATYNPETASIKYIANGDYFEDISSSDTWTGSGETVTLDVTGGNPPPTSMFALMADNTDILGSAIVVTTLYKHINASGTITGEDGVTVDTNSLWLSLGETDIAPVVYSGTIYFQVAER
jgi:hypothetical protein